MTGRWTHTRAWTTVTGAVAIAGAVLLMLVGGFTQSGPVATVAFGSGFTPAGAGHQALLVRDGGVGITVTRSLTSLGISLRVESYGVSRRVSLQFDGVEIGSGQIRPGRITTIAGTAQAVAVGGHGLHVIVDPGAFPGRRGIRAIVDDPIAITPVEAP